MDESLELKSIPLDDFPGYFADKNGNIWSTRLSEVPYKLKQRLCKSGYSRNYKIYRVCFLNNGKRKYIGVHRVVALAFYGIPDNEKLEVRHLNGNSLDNRPSNLKWGTSSDNHEDARLHGTMKKGESSYLTKLKKEQAIEIIESPDSYHSLGKRYNVAFSTIRDIKKGRSWKELDDFRKLTYG